MGRLWFISIIRGNSGAGAPFGPLGIVVGGALSAAAGTAINGGSWNDIGKSAFVGSVSAYVGGKFAKGAG